MMFRKNLVLKYNTEAMDNVVKSYRECADQMDQLYNQMQNLVDNLGEAWKTEAGNEFFKKFDDEWVEGFNQYKEVLRHMANSLEKAESQYEELTLQAEKLNIMK